MSFGKHLRQYREEELNITQIEAAYMLGLVPNTYSNYERDERPIPIELLSLIKEKFNIPDEQFLDMVLDRPREKKKLPIQMVAMQTKDLRERYIINFGESHFDLIEHSPELRQLLSFVQMQDSKKRRLFLNAVKSILQIYEDLLNQKNDGRE